jgi:hypothetical protein
MVPRKKNRCDLTSKTLFKEPSQAQKGQAREVFAIAREAVVQLQKKGVYYKPGNS